MLFPFQMSFLFLIRIVAIALFNTVAIFIFVNYIQSIGSGIGSFSGLFLVTFIFMGQPEPVQEWLSLYLNGNLLCQVPFTFFFIAG